MGKQTPYLDEILRVSNGEVRTTHLFKHLKTTFKELSKPMNFGIRA